VVVLRHANSERLFSVTYDPPPVLGPQLTKKVEMPLAAFPGLQLKQVRIEVPLWRPTT
jgi:hypothetical protein